MKSYPQETISKTDGPIRQKNKTGIKEGGTRKKKYNRGDIAEAFKLFVLFFQYSLFSLLYFILVCVPIPTFRLLGSFLLPFYPFFFVTAFYFFSLFFFP